jgi:hypothetical protein
LIHQQEGNAPLHVCIFALLSLYHQEEEIKEEFWLASHKLYEI